METSAFLVQPETLLRWHRELFRVFWKHKSKAHARKPKLSPETISLIQEMAANNRLWEAERIRGELLKLDIRESQTNYSEAYAEGARHSEPVDRPGRPFSAIMRPKCGPVIFCRWRISSFAHSLRSSTPSLRSRKVIHVNVTRAPTDSWVARTATRGNSIRTNTQIFDSR